MQFGVLLPPGAPMSGIEERPAALFTCVVAILAAASALWWCDSCPDPAASPSCTRTSPAASSSYRLVAKRPADVAAAQVQQPRQAGQGQQRRCDQGGGLQAACQRGYGGLGGGISRLCHGAAGACVVQPASSMGHLGVISEGGGGKPWCMAAHPGHWQVARVDSQWHHC